MFDTKLFDDFEVKYVEVKLSNIPNYHTTFNLNGNTIFMTVTYNTRSNSREIILETLSSEVILSQTTVRYGRRCELNFNATQNGLDYYVTLKPKDITKVFDNTYDYINWADDFVMCFVGWDYSFTLRAEQNKRTYLTGN